MDNFKLTDSEVINTILNSINYAFCEEHIKEELRRRLVEVTDKK
jgi:adenosine deaminase